MKIEPNYIKVTMPDGRQLFSFSKLTGKPKMYADTKHALEDIEKLKIMYNNPDIKFEITENLKIELTYMQKIKRFFGKNKRKR